MTYAPATRHRAGLMLARHAELVETNGIWAKTSTGSANAQIIYPEFTGYLTGNPRYDFIAGYTNTNALTISTDNGATFVSARKSDGSLMVGGEVVAGTMYSIRHDGTYWRLIGGAGGGVSFPTLAKSGAYTVGAGDAGKLIVTTGTWTLSLPAAGAVGTGFTIAVKNVGTGLITVDPSGTELVDLALTGLLASRQSVILVCDGTGWLSIGGLGFSTGQQWSTTAISGGITMSEGNLRAALSGNTTSYQTVRGANALPDGASYWEVSCLSFPSVGSDSGLLGIVDASFTDFVNRPLSPGAYQTDGTLRKTSGSTAFGASWGGGDTMMFAFKRPAGSSGSLWIGKNGVWQGSGDPVAGTNAAITAISQQVFPMASANLAPVYRARFSPLEFVYTMPSGFSPLA